MRTSVIGGGETALSSPERYARRERGRVSMHLSGDVPVVDLSRIVKGDDCNNETEMEKLRRACLEWGTFYITNHGIPTQIMEEVQRVGRELFVREDEAMKAERHRISAANRADMQGYGQTYAVADSKSLDWGELLSLIMSPASRRDYEAWPCKPHQFRQTLQTYHVHVMSVARCVVAAVAQAAKLSPKTMLHAFGLDNQSHSECAAFVKMRMNMYRACEWAETVNGLSPHADMAGVTVLLQDEHEVGLHLLKDQQWVGVRPVPGALVVMLGNIMELLTNGVFRSVVHRAVPNRRSHRLSVPFFIAPPLDSLVSPLLGSHDYDDNHEHETTLPLFRQFVHRDYVQFYMSRRAVEGKSSFYSFAALPHHPDYPPTNIQY